MKIDLFSVPIYITNIDLEKLKLSAKEINKTWLSETPSSLNSQHMMEAESLEYILREINSLLNPTVDCKIKLKKIWENHYKEGDFQESHVHAGSHFSFIIYKKISESKTVFFNPAANLIESYYINSPYKPIQDIFEPKCRQGQMIVFPSFLTHMVKKSKDSITISGNIEINFKG